MLEIQDSLKLHIFTAVNHDAQMANCDVLDGQAGYLYSLLLILSWSSAVQLDQSKKDYVPYGGILQRFNRKKALQ